MNEDLKALREILKKGLLLDDLRSLNPEELKWVIREETEAEIQADVQRQKIESKCDNSVQRLLWKSLVVWVIFVAAPAVYILQTYPYIALDLVERWPERYPGNPISLIMLGPFGIVMVIFIIAGFIIRKRASKKLLELGAVD
jgi:hypothetical protein